MKKTISLIAVILVLSIVLCSCGSTKNEQLYKIGDAVATDIAEFTLEYGSFSVALDNTRDENYLRPKEYNPDEDTDNPYVAAKGNTMVAIEFTLKNLDRTSLDVQRFIEIEYKDANSKKKNSSALDIKARCENGFDWDSFDSINILLLTGESASYRGYLEIDTEIADLTSPFKVIVKLPTSDGKETEFVYEVTEEGRAAYSGRSITFEQALEGFQHQEARDYFTEHQNEFEDVPGDRIAQLVNAGTWKVTYGKPGMYWSGKFEFLTTDSDTEGVIYDDYGYANKRTWEVKGDTLILNGDIVCTMKAVDTRVYLLINEGQAYALFRK